METYTQLKDRQRRELDDFPMVFAFSNEQFKEGMEKLGLTVNDTDKIYSIHGGGFILKTDSKKLANMYLRHGKEFDNAVKSDIDGKGFIFQAFMYELANHEYCITYDVTDALQALGFTMEEVNSNPIMKEALSLAKSRQGQWV